MTRKQSATAIIVLDLGPGGGIHGGTVVAAGTVTHNIVNSSSFKYRARICGTDHAGQSPRKAAPSNTWLTVTGANEHNLKNIDVAIPLGTFHLHYRRFRVGEIDVAERDHL